ncbi:MAG: alanine--tRNA ligase [Xanthomonadaceae bacterium]|nr:alanine--tRNA ligase [Xanthomonadaceae bacterium]MDE1965290.1 alanine--tRNA ligase [Xanthomonadaceae bacterium]
MKTAEIRSAFLEFFRAKDHTIVPSASLVPSSDPTLLFTNSGMVPFKNVFLGSEKLPYVRAADVQRCLRAGGKHNDLDSVGYTARHHTFFEMLGNWSFGDYFKREAIAWAWELLTGVFKLPAEKLWVTVYHTDDEAFELWNKTIGVPAERIVRIGDNKGAPYASDNFWQMADTGPCGPCTEIFYDHGPDVAGGPPGSPDEDGDRYIEIWNLVFMQFDRAPDGTLSPLPAPCVDTGMGLERLAAVLQHVHSNYEIDLFQRLIEVAAELTNTPDLSNKSLRVIADHIRACSFLIIDGVQPSNEGRGYVLRRIIRRAIRHIYKLHGLSAEGYFWRMVKPLVEEMGEAYPELVARRGFVEEVLQAEERSFAQTLDSGMMHLESYLEQSKGQLTGEHLFLLHDTYGCPPDLIADVVRERSLSISPTATARYEELMNEQRERARAAGKFEAKGVMPAELASQLKPTEFLGYEALAADGAKVVGIVRAGRQVDQLAAGEEGFVILDRTPFYAESGGQVGDTGTLSGAGGTLAVADTLKMGGVFFGHAGRWQGAQPLRQGDVVNAVVDGERRQAIVLNHSATHLLHAALRKVLGDHVTQKGSLVAPDRLRFDFAHHKPVSRAELAEIEAMVNAEVRRNAEAEVRHMAYDDAIAFGAMALFGEKYGDEVRVLKMGGFSTELCGGTHVGRTGDIGLFKIVSEAGVASGVRRIEAVTGAGALAYVADEERRLGELAHLLSGNGDEVVDKLRQLFEKQKKLERELESLRARAAGSATAELAASASEVRGIKVVAARLEGLDAKALRDSVDQLKQQLGDCVVLLAGAADGRVSLVAGVHGAALGRIKAGEVVAHVAGQIGGKGGGRPDMAQGGGDDVPQLSALLAGLPGWIGDRAGA